MASTIFIKHHSDSQSDQPYTNNSKSNMSDILCFPNNEILEIVIPAIVNEKNHLSFIITEPNPNLLMIRFPSVLDVMLKKLDLVE